MPPSLEDRAKRHFGFAERYPNALLPKSYLQELEKHLAKYPFDDNFAIERQAKKGYGILTCREDGCDVAITLTPLPGIKDGKRAGVGSLAEFQKHIEAHPTHKKNCLHRVGKEPRQIGAEENGVATRAVAGIAGDDARRRVFERPPQPSALQKRPSESAFGAVSAALPAAKKLKQEPQEIAVPKSPLAVKTNMTLEARPSMTVDDAREQLQDVVKKFMDTEARYDRLSRKKGKTKTDLTILNKVRVDLDDLRRRKDELKTRVLTAYASPRKRVKTESSVSLAAPPMYMPPAAFSSPDTKPPVRAFLAPPPQVRPSVSSNAVAGPSRVGMNAVAGPSRPSGQGVPVHVKQEGQLAYERDRFMAAHGLLKQEPVATPLPPRYTSPAVASSSKVTMSPPLKPGELPFNRRAGDMSDDEGEGGLGYNSDALAEIQANAIVNRVGLEVPPPVEDDRDEDGLYHGRGRDLYQGPRANADDIDKFLLLAGNAEQFDDNASVAQALAKLGLKDQFDLIPGMEISLMAHQTIGVAWMVEKEKSALRGGCLADDMGLGKTVQMMATILKNPPINPAVKSTLILAPLALLDQWKTEFEMKTNAGLKVLIYHGSNKPRRKKDVLEYDVVLTTYSTMALEWPDFEAQAKKKKKAKRRRQKETGFIVPDSDESSDDDARGKGKGKKNKNEPGILFQIDWYRIVLDEAQNIRNRLTRASRAASELTSTLRWCLTGTPIINGLGDCYGYIRFLKLRPWYDWDKFNEHICRKEKKSPQLAVTRLQAIITTYQIRRTKDSMLDGKRLIELPTKEINLTQLEFSEEEAQIYSMVEARSQAKFNRYLREGTVLKNYHHVLVLLLRLRQICSHPCLIHEDVVAFVHKDEVDNSKAEVFTEVSRARRLTSKEWVEEAKEMFKQRALNRMAAEKASVDAALEDEDCAICFEIMDDTAVFTRCKHIFCKECIHGFLDTPIPAGPEGEAHGHPCPKCRAPISKEMLFERAAFEPTEKELNPHAASDDEDGMDVDEDEDDRKGKGKGKARAARSSRRGVSYAEDDDDDDLSDFIVETDEDEEEKDARKAMKQHRLGKRRANVILDTDDEMDTPEDNEVLMGRKTKEQLSREAVENMSRFLPSTKMKYMMEIIQKSFEKRPDEKILVVSQWTGCLKLVSDYLGEKGIGHVMYQGDMNRDKRDAAVRVFMSKNKARVMLMSLKCGGVGLNLTRANNVISLDLAWSRAVESQAWDRVHRLGQTRPVDVQRLVIANTVEDRIIALQDRKQSLADGSMGEGKGKKIGRLTVGELANLFGLDVRGNRLE